MKYDKIIFSDVWFNDKFSAWIEHYPFALFIVEKLRPKVFVELGTHYGGSYFSFCQTIKELKISTKAYAIDSWTGDEHAGFYGQEVFNYVNKINNEHFSYFSNLIKATFDEASQYFENGSIDLLHIDGLHTYEAVKHDFEIWLPKMSDKGVIIFHDTAVKERGFGVWKLMDELKTKYPYFEFSHGYGLGVLCTGRNVNPGFLEFVKLAADDGFTQKLFENVGRKTWLEHHVNQQDLTIANIKQIIGLRDAEINNLQQALNEKEHELQHVSIAAEAHLHEIDELNFLLSQITKTLSWKITAPLRYVKTMLTSNALHLSPNLMLIEKSKLFDAHYYLHNNKDVKESGMNPARHFLLYGGFEGRNPSERFDTNFYLEQNPDVKESVINPLVHYILFGKNEGREVIRNYEKWRTILKGDYCFKVSPDELKAQAGKLDFSVLIVAEITLPQCYKYRVLQKAEMFGLLDVRCSVVDWRNTGMVLSLLQTYNMVIFYRVPANDETLGMAEEAGLLGLKCFFELDDLIFDEKLYRANPNLKKLNDLDIDVLMNGASLYRKMLVTCRNVIASTDELAERMWQVGKGEKIVVENAIDRETLEIAKNIQKKRIDKKIKIFYGSGTNTHDTDFLEASEALIQVALENQNIEIVLAGDIEPPVNLKMLTGQLKIHPHLPFDKYLQLLAEADISIAPLVNTPFNDAKSNIKYLEASILGIPSVCSPRSAFCKVIKHAETGFLANTSGEWYSALKTLANDGKLRQSIGEAAKENVLKSYTFEHIAQSQLRALCNHNKQNTAKKLRMMSVNVFFSPNSFGGATIVAEALVKLLVKEKKIESAVFTTSYHNEIPMHELVRTTWEGVPVFRTAISIDEILSPKYENERIDQHFKEALLAYRPDIVHFHSIQGLGSGIAKVCMDMKIPYIITLHDAWWLCEHQFLVTSDGKYCGRGKTTFVDCENCVKDIEFTRKRSADLRKVLDGAALLLTPGKYWRDFYLANGIEPAHIRVNKNGIAKPIEIHPNAGGNGRLRFGFVAGNEPVKGFLQVKAAFESLQSGNWELIIVDHSNKMNGGNPFPDEINGKGKVHFVEKYTLETIDKFFGMIDVLLFPTQFPESFGLTVREALIRNKWVIASDAGGIAEAIQNGINGTLIPLSSDSSFLRNAVEEMISSSQKLKGWVNPRNHIIRSFDEQAEELYEIIGEIVAGNSRR